jgi:hypothetical protein
MRTSCAIINDTQPLYESQRDSVTQPRVARNELPWVCQSRVGSTLKGLRLFAAPARFAEEGAHRDATLSGLVKSVEVLTQGSACRATLGWWMQSRWDCPAAHQREEGSHEPIR